MVCVAKQLSVKYIFQECLIYKYISAVVWDSNKWGTDECVKKNPEQNTEFGILSPLNKCKLIKG